MVKLVRGGWNQTTGSGSRILSEDTVLRGGGTNVDSAVGALTGAAGLPATFASRADWQTFAIALLNKTTEISSEAIDVEILTYGFVGLGGHGNDRFVINNVGDAHIRAGGGNDFLSTTSGWDTLDGGAGDDTMSGGGGNDTYWVDSTGDVVTEFGGSGVDEVVSQLASYTLAANVEGLRGILATGQVLRGNGLNNTIQGGGGADYLDGAAGADTMDGGAGSDTYVLDDSGDVVVERADGGWDAVFTSVSFAAGEHVESVTLTTEGIQATGGAGANLLVSRQANTQLTGGGGNDVYVLGTNTITVTEAADGGYDTLILEQMISYAKPANIELVITRGYATSVTGTTGDDTFLNQGANTAFFGGLGNDSYIVTQGLEIIYEYSGQGNDSVFASISFALHQNVESLYLRGNNLTGTGNAGDNVLASEGAGNTLIGKAGSDAYLILTGDEIVTEAANEGYDVIYSVTNFTIAANVEALVLTGAGRTAIGGAGGDLLMSAAFNNVLNGGGGGDLLLAGAYGDRLIGGAGGDVFAFQAANGAADARRFKIDDFNAAQGDVVDILRIDANSTLAGHQSFVGKAAFTGQAGQAVLTDLGGGQYRLAGDIDGDGLADFVLDITASGAFGWGDILS